MPSSTIKQHTLKEYVDSLINAKLIAVVSRLGDTGIDEQALLDILSESSLIDWLDNQTWLSAATENDRRPDALDRKLSAGRGVYITTLNPKENEQLLISTLPMDNKILNGNFDIDTRTPLGAQVQVVTSSGSPTYNTTVVDKWRSSANVADDLTLTYETESTVVENNSLKVSVTNSSGNNLVEGEFIRPFRQAISSKRCLDLVGKTLTIAFDLETNFTGKLLLELSAIDITSTYRIVLDVVPGVNSIEHQIELPIGSIISASPISLIVEIGCVDDLSDVNTAVNEWIDDSVKRPKYLTKWYASIGNFIKISKFRLTEGRKSSEFIPRLPSIENLLCKEFYCKFNYNTVLYNFVTTSTAAYDTMRFKLDTVFLPNPLMIPLSVSVRSLVNGTVDRITHDVSGQEFYWTGSIGTSRGTITLHNKTHSIEDTINASGAKASSFSCIVECDAEPVF